MLKKRELPMLALLGATEEVTRRLFADGGSRAPLLRRPTPCGTAANVPLVLELVPEELLLADVDDSLAGVTA